MSKKTKRDRDEAAAAEAGESSPTVLIGLAGLALASAVWSAFQWNELISLREGGEIFCASGSDGCALLADGAFAVAVQTLSGLPIPGWGLVWSGAALALPIGALLRRGVDRSEEPFWTATLCVAAAGLGSVAVLAAVSALEGSLCANCLITYGIVCAYAGLAGMRFVRAKDRAGLQLSMGAAVTAIATAVGFVALLYPGLQTPFPRQQEADAALSKALASKPHAEHDHASHAGPAALAPGAELGSLDELITSMSPEMRQALSNTIAEYAASRPNAGPPARALVGSTDSPVRITDFTDTLCGHCASLHKTLAFMRDQLPEGSFAIDSRHFPLDGNCNPEVSKRHEDPVRCVAASAQICLEDHPSGFEFAGRLYESQQTLDVDMVYQLGAPYMARAELEACVASGETSAKLQADIARALEFDIRGTPLVLINDRLGSAFGPFLYAMVATGGQTKDPAFARLPIPRPGTH
jgi:hypothetical protein